MPTLRYTQIETDGRRTTLSVDVTGGEAAGATKQVGQISGTSYTLRKSATSWWGQVQSSVNDHRITCEVEDPAAPWTPFTRCVLFAVGGQSNAVGENDGVLPDPYPQDGNGSRIWQFGCDFSWKQATEPLHSNAHIIDSIGNNGSPEVAWPISFASRLLTQRSYDVALLPCAVGGTSSTQWAQNTARGALYGAMVARIKHALRRPGTEFGGLLWDQGGSDGGDEATAGGWASRTQAIFDALRTDLGLATLKVRYVLTPSGTGAVYPALATLRSQQQSIQGTHQKYVEPPASPASDASHFSVAQGVTIGRDMADGAIADGWWT